MFGIFSYLVTAAGSPIVGFLVGWRISAWKLVEVLDRLAKTESGLDWQISLTKDIAGLLTALLAEAEKLGLAHEVVSNISDRLARI